MTPSPFPSTTSKAGHGEIYLALLPPSTPSFSTLTYAYPLKLLPSAPHKLHPPQSRSPQINKHNDAQKNHEEIDSLGFNDAKTQSPSTVPLLFLLTYGGGLLAGDTTTINMTLEASTRLTAATQGMTRIYAPPLTGNPSSATNTSSPSASSTTLQTLKANLHAHSALWLAPDPVQPYARSTSTQTQLFRLQHPSASVGFIDWICEGRKSRGESWKLESWRSRNEIWLHHQDAEGHQRDVTPRRRLLVRDSIILEGARQSGRGTGPTIMDGKGIFGSLILYGPAFESLAQFFHAEFEAMERIGGRDWSAPTFKPPSLLVPEKTQNHVPTNSAVKTEDPHTWRRRRQDYEKRDELLWTACRLVNRGGATIVKFSAREVEGGRRWLGEMLRKEGTIPKDFGEGGLMFMR